MSILSFAPNHGIVASGRSTVVISVPGCEGRSKPLALVRIPSRRVSWRCSRQRIAVSRGSPRITACAAPPAPCQSLEASAPVLDRVGFGGVTFESSALQTVKNELVFQQARSPELIRTAAYLRAVSFYPFPEGRSEEAVQVLCLSHKL